jgi:phospho-N-acetylmuramoyl-pentapeptide-transferase
MLYYFYLLYDWLKDSQLPVAKGLNVFRYITFRSAGAAFTAFFISLIIGPRVIAVLKLRNIGEETDRSDSSELNQRHKGKKGTPTMGGVMIVFAIVISTLLWTPLDNLYTALVLTVLWSLAMVGFADDQIKLASARRKGIRARTKLAFQLGIGLAAAIVLYIQFSAPNSVIAPSRNIASVESRASNEGITETQDDFAAVAQESVQKVPGDSGTAIYLPFFKNAVIRLGLLFILFGMLTVAATSNAVNLTDGLDGLAVGCLALVCAAFTVLSYLSGRADYSAYLGIPYVPGSGELTVFCASMTGACLGFLWFNCHPAKLFMGNVGAVSLGGAIGLVALIVKQELMLLIIGGVFVVELLSVVMQVVSFKLTGKRIFKIAPLHHHFEFSNVPENQITVRFWIAAALLALAGVATLKLR